MILGPINGVDCVAFIVFLIPQLIYQVDWSLLVSVLVRVVPFLCMLTQLLFAPSSLLTSFASHPTTISTHSRAILRQAGAPVTLCSACQSVPRCGHTLR